jgi:hypothetical protein
MSALRLESGRCMICGTNHQGTIAASPPFGTDVLHLTSLTTSSHDLPARACLPAVDSSSSAKQSTLHDCLPCLAPNPKVARCVSELRAYLGDRSSLLLPSNRHINIHIYANQPTSPTPTPTPPALHSPSHVYPPAVRPPPNCPPERPEAPGPELRRRLWAMSGADSMMGRLST